MTQANMLQTRKTLALPKVAVLAALLSAMTGCMCTPEFNSIPEGYVNDAVTGSPIEGTLITYSRKIYTPSPMSVQSVSDSDGHFTINQVWAWEPAAMCMVLASVDQSITIEKPGFKTQVITSIPYSEKDKPLNVSLYPENFRPFDFMQHD